MKRFALAALAAVSLMAGCATMPGSATKAEDYQAAVASPIRTDADRTMDARRHPAQLLAFAQVKPGMKVLDVAAGGGYTTQVLALAVGPEGKVWAQTPNPSATLAKRLADQPQANIIVAKRPFEDPVPEEAQALDLVTIVLNYHDFTYLPIDRAKMNQRIFAALKPGGSLVIVDHAAAAGTGISAGKTLHRIEQSVVVQEAQAAGFTLEAEAPFLRNADDTRLTPSGDMRENSDRFVLRFVKPAARSTGRY
jgi:predicted methyltransferase